MKRSYTKILSDVQRQVLHSELDKATKRLSKKCKQCKRILPALWIKDGFCGSCWTNG